MTKVQRSVRGRVRRATVSDARALAVLRYRLRASIGRAQEPMPAFLTRCARWMRSRLADASWLCWVAVIDGTIVGALWLHPIEKVPNPVGEPERHAYLTSVFVEPAARGCGLGTRLLNTAIDWSRRHGVDAVVLWPTSRSRSLYRRAGAHDARDVLEFRPVTKT